MRQTKLPGWGVCTINELQGDSGGPLICEDENGAWKINGIVSWGANECGDEFQTGVYVNVPFYRSWIDDYVEKVRARVLLRFLDQLPH